MEMLLNTFLMASEGGLEIKLLEIAIHMLNLVILITFLKMLVYKPTLNFINKRKKQFEDMIDENKQLTAEAERIKSSSAEIISQARQNAEFISLEATKEAERKGKAILSEAKEKSDALVERTKKDMQNEKLRIEQEVKQQVVELAVELASKVLEREVTQVDNDKIIDSCLEGWSKT